MYNQWRLECSKTKIMYIEYDHRIQSELEKYHCMHQLDQVTPRCKPEGRLHTFHTAVSRLNHISPTAYYPRKQESHGWPRGKWSVQYTWHKFYNEWYKIVFVSVEILLSVLLYGPPFRVTANFSCGGGGGHDHGETNAINGESGYVQWYVLLPRGPKFSSVLLYGLPFQSYSQF